MANIIIYTENVHKSIAKQITAFLKKKGHNIIPIDYKQNKPQIAVVIFSQKVNTAKKLIDFYDSMFEKNIPIILYVISDLEYSLSMKNFLENNYWVDAYETTRQEAFSALNQLITQIINSDAQKKYEPNEKNQNNRKILIGVVIAILIILIGYFIYIQLPQQNNNNISTLTTQNDSLNLTTHTILPQKDKLFREYLIGKWKLTNYSDNQIYSPEELQNIKQQIEKLKQNFLLILKDDNTFDRYGFSPQGEHGYWDVDPQNKILYIGKPGSQLRDKLTIKELTPTTLKLVINTKDKNNRIITTILELKKVK